MEIDRTDAFEARMPEPGDLGVGSVSGSGMRLVTVAMAIACGLIVANLYYSQPLLALIAHGFHVSEGAATVVVTASQVGYAIGLVLLLPLGDLLENRKLICRLLLATAAALVVAVVAPSFSLFVVMLVLVGITSAAAQILVPFAAHLAPPAERGKFVGQVMSGLLLGILLARTVASEVASAWGWRSIYGISAGLMLATSLGLARVLPRRLPDHQARYVALLISSLALVRDERVLRKRALGQAFMFGAFSCFWTAIAYELIAAHHFTQAEIGLFALVGAAGAAAAPVAGWLGDHGHGPTARLAAGAVGAAAMVTACLGASSIVLLAASGVLLDLAVQCHQVTSQREIYALRDDARARINSVFMGTVFIGGAICSAITGLLHDTVGWSGITIFAASLCGGSFFVSFIDRIQTNHRRVAALLAAS